VRRPGVLTGSDRRVDMIARVAGIGVVLGLLAGSLAGCGVRGALDGPSAKTRTGATTLTAPTKVGEPVAKPPHRDFPLDALIR
jgi:predicted small lipoprotein YifL